MKIGLFGYGKMGRVIERLASAHGVEIVWKISRENRASVSKNMLREAQVVIEFTRPEAAFENIRLCLEAGVPVVSGTTGWLERLGEAKEICAKNDGAFFWASNFSIGVNLFFELNKTLARLMNGRENYRPTLTEIHHIHKLDAPSGTAVTLAEGLISQSNRFKHYQKMGESLSDDNFLVESVRQGEVPGTHQIEWKSAVDSIEIRHEAFSREGFADGALVAAKWLGDGRRGYFEMSDLLGF